MNRSSLSREQWNILNKYRITEKYPQEGEDATCFLNEKEMKDFLEERLRVIGTSNLKVAASLFMKRYAFVAAMGLLSMTYWNRRLNLSPYNLMISDGENNGLWLPNFFLKDPTIYTFTSEEEKREYIKFIFRNHLNRVVQIIKKTTNISALILWENIAVYIFWIYENDTYIQNEGNKQTRDKDFHLLLQETNRHLFGGYHNNPLSRFYRHNIEDFPDKIRVRKTCCLSYMLENGERYRCKTCPASCKIPS